MLVNDDKRGVLERVWDWSVDAHWDMMQWMKKHPFLVMVYVVWVSAVGAAITEAFR